MINQNQFVTAVCQGHVYPVIQKISINQTRLNNNFQKTLKGRHTEMHEYMYKCIENVISKILLSLLL